MSNTCVYDKPPCDHAALRRILGPGRFRRGSMRTRRPITPAYQCPPGGTKPSQAVGRRTGYRPNVFAEPAHGVTDSLGDRAPALSTPWLTERTRPVTNWSATSGSWNDLSPTNSPSVSGWTPASDGGATITSYQVSVNGGSWTTVSTSSSTSVVNANLVNHRDRRSHGAHQRHGVHDPGSRDQQCGKRDGEQLSAWVTPMTVPGGPTGVSAVAGNGSVVVSFTSLPATAVRRSPGARSRVHRVARRRVRRAPARPRVGRTARHIHSRRMRRTRSAVVSSRRRRRRRR